MAKITLKVTSAFMLGGRMRVPGSIVRADAKTARDLIRRGKAQEASSDVSAEFEEDDADEGEGEKPEQATAKKGDAGAAKAKAGDAKPS